MSSSEPFPLLAKTFTGLESVLAEELAGLGARDVAPGRRMVAFSGDQELLYRANLCCRTAVRILKPLGTFELDPAQDAARALYAGLEQFDWSRWLDASGTLTIDPVVHNSPLANSLYAAQVAKDAIADWFRTRYDRRPSVERHEPDLRINLHIDARRVTVYLDASDQSLHKRGYRGAAGEAPLNEVLAAGILRLAGWDGSGTSGDAAPLVDFMCGSGTLPIEAALIAANIAPGLVRKQFGYMRWPDFDRRLHERLLDEARRARRSIEPGLIFGSDIDERAIAAATAGAARAGVGGAIQFSVGNFEAIVPPAPSGTLVFNPAYDERLKVERIAAFYRRIGDVLKRRWSGYTAWMFTGNLVAAKQIGLRTAARIPLNNGPIECRLLKFPLFALASAAESQAPPPAPELPAASAAKSATGPADEPALTAEVADTDLPAADSPEIAEPDLQDSAPVAPGHPAKPASDQALAEFTNRLRRMGKHWSRWARRQGITCYRIYDRDIPEVPLTIDRYEHQLYIAEHARPHGRTPIEQRLWLARLVQAAGELLGAAAADVFVHGREPADRPQRTAQRADCQRIRSADQNQPVQPGRAGSAAGRAGSAPLDCRGSSRQAVFEPVRPGRSGQRIRGRRRSSRHGDDRKFAGPGRLVARESGAGRFCRARSCGHRVRRARAPGAMGGAAVAAVRPAAGRAAEWLPSPWRATGLGSAARTARPLAQSCPWSRRAARFISSPRPGASSWKPTICRALRSGT